MARIRDGCGKSLVSRYRLATVILQDDCSVAGGGLRWSLPQFKGRYWTRPNKTFNPPKAVKGLPGETEVVFRTG